MTNRIRIFGPVFLSLALLSIPALVRSQTSERESEETLSRPVALPPLVGLYQNLGSIPDAVRGSAPFARALSEMVRHAGLDGVWDEDAFIQAREQSEQDLLKSSAVAEKGVKNGIQPLANAWTNIGLIGTSGNNVFSAGCTSAIAFDPTNPNTMYVGGTSGGVWKSTDGGASWVSLTDLIIPNQSIASIAVDPKNHNTVYVGTGNGFASVDELTGTGLWKTTNGGGNWSHIGSSSLTGTVIKVLVDPVNSNVVFASSYKTGATCYVYRSTDSGVTWTKVYTAAQPVWDMVSGTVSGGVPILYFAEGNNPGGASSECGVYKSGNDGVSWTKVSGLPPGGRVGRCALAASVAHPERVFVLMAEPDGNIINVDSSLWRSTDNGLTWGFIAVPSTLFDPTTQQAPQGWYDCSLAVGPNSQSSHDTIYIGGIEAYYNFSDNKGWINYSSYNWAIPASHVDHHSFAVNPKNTNFVYDGCDGGLYWSEDYGYANTGNFTTSWTYRSNAMVTNRFYHIGLDPSDSKTTFGGAQDQGTWKLVTNTIPVQVAEGDGMQPISNSTNSTNPYYYELPNGDIYDHNGTQLTGSMTSVNDNAFWDAPFKMGIATNGGVPPYDLLYEGREHLWVSEDGGGTWNMISGSYGYPYIRSIGLSHSDVNTIYIGTTGAIAITTDGGTSWNSTSSGLPGAGVTSIVTTNKNTNFALASFYTQSGARVMKTTNKGSTWVNVSGSSGSALPQVGVNCVALDSIDPLRIWYAATDNGIYYTMDTGVHWSIAGSGIGLASCSDVEVQANKLTIRVATFGRGIWEGATNTLPVELAGLSYQKQTTGTIGTILDWHTDSELGDAYFGVERSIDGGAFQEIAQVPSKAPGGNSSTELDYSFFDSTHAPGEYIYQLKQVDLDGSVHFSNFVELNWGTTGLIVSQNYPNPFLVGLPSTSVNNSSLFGTEDQNSITAWPVTRFHYELPTADQVSLKIYSSIGVLVRTLIDNVSEQPGDPDAFWDGRDDSGGLLPSGTYFYVLSTAHYGSVINKLVMLTE